MSKLNLIQNIFLILSVSCCILAKLPDDLAKCGVGDNQCIINDIDVVFNKKFNGDDAFGLRALDPMIVGNVGFKQDPKSPVNIEIKFENSILIGTKDMKTLKVKGFGKSPEGRHHLLITTPNLQFLSDYTASGKVLIIPVQGVGKSNITFVNYQVKCTIDATSETKNNQTFLKVKNITLDMECDQFFMHFTNLFNGDKVLGDNMNKFINENSKEIFYEIKPSIEKMLTKSATETIEGIFSKTPYNELVQI